MRHVAIAVVLAAAIVPGCGGGGGGGGGGGSTGGGGGGGGGGGTPPSAYFPTWAGVAPTSTTYVSPVGSATANGAALASAISALGPGDRLIVNPGTYSVNMWWNVVLVGTAAAPIWIEGATGGAKPVITRPDANQNVMNVGSGSPTRYVCFRNLEFTGGDDLIKLYDCQNVWIDQCYIHNGSGVGIAANSANTSALYITQNEIAQPGGAGDTGEGMYLGANYSAVRMTNSVIALNHVHDTYGTSQGDGIEVKQGSYGNWIVENWVHDTNYPCILVYGTDGLGINIVERNTCYNSNDNTMQVQGEAIIRNNLIMNGATGFASTDHQGTTTNLQVIHNTIVNSARATNLSSWNARGGMVFANNACYSQTAEAIRFPNGSSGVTLAGNVRYGSLLNVPGGYTTGNGLSDFTNVTWDAVNRNGLPSAGSALIGAGSATYGTADDITGATRSAPVDAGAWDRP